MNEKISLQEILDEQQREIDEDKSWEMEKRTIKEQDGLVYLEDKRRNICKKLDRLDEKKKELREELRDIEGMILKR